MKTKTPEKVDKLEEAKKLIAELEQKELEAVTAEFEAYIKSLSDKGFFVTITNNVQIQKKRD